MNGKHLYVDINVVQTVPPSCVNRDDTGSPKTAVYGGATRARVSSQAWKRAMRLMFRELFPEEKQGVRTKHIVEMVAEEIRAKAPEVEQDTAETWAATALTRAKLGIKSTEKGTDALFFLSRQQARALAELVIAEPPEADKKTEEKPDKQTTARYQAALKSEPAVDMALFGRMVASDPSLNYDAAAQVAHSISTHAVQNEFDYFTAVDDRQPQDNAGAGHVGLNEYNAATLYRYATVDVNALAESLGAETPEVVRGFVEAFVRAMPTGKQNSYANRTLPDAVYVTVRHDQPVNLSGAFEKPIRPSAEGYAGPSVQALNAYAQKLYQSFADAPAAAFGVGEALEGLAEIMPLTRLLDQVQQTVSAQLKDRGVV